MEENEKQIPTEEPARAPEPERTPEGFPPPPVQVVTYLPYGMTPETYQEKKGIRKTANTIGISLLITETVFMFWSVAVFFLAARFGISRLTMTRFLIDPVMQQILQIVLSTVAFLLPAVLLFKAREGNVSEMVALSAPKKGTVAPMFLFGMSFCMFANVAVSILGQFFSNIGIEYHSQKTEYPTGAAGFCLSFLATCIFPAVIEEFVFRGLIMGSLRKYGDGFAVLISSALFGLVHGNFEQIPFAFLVGQIGRASCSERVLPTV